MSDGKTICAVFRVQIEEPPKPHGSSRPTYETNCTVEGKSAILPCVAV